MGVYLFASHQHTKWAQRNSQITPQQAQRAIAQADALGKAVNQYVSEHGIDKEKLYFLGGGANYTGNFDIDLSRLSCDKVVVGSCNDGDFEYLALCVAETNKCFVTVGSPVSTEQKWYYFPGGYNIPYEVWKNCPNDIVGTFWVRQLYPEQKNFSVICEGPADKNALCTYLKGQEVEKSIREIPNQCSYLEN